MKSAKFNERFELALWVSLVRISKNLSEHSHHPRIFSQNQNTTIETPKFMIQIIASATIGLILGLCSGVVTAIIQ